MRSNEPAVTSNGNSVVKNTSVLMVSQAITWGLSLLLIVFLPRYLGAQGIGQFHLAGSIWNIVGIFVVFGMDMLLMKEIARKPGKTSELVGITLILRLLFSIIGFVAVALYIQIAGYIPLTALVIYVIGVSSLVTQISAAFRSSLIGLERMEYVALADIAAKIFATVVTIAILLMGYGVVAAAIVAIGSSLINVCIQYFYLRRLQRIRIDFDWESARWMLRASFPYLLVMVFTILYANLDAIIISLVLDETVVGWYGVAAQLFGTLLFIPTVFVTAVFPVLSRTYTNAPDALPRVFSKSFDMLLVLGVPIGLGIVAISNQLVSLLFGQEFAPSGQVLAIIGLVLILTYQNTLIGRFLISVDRQNAWTMVMAAALLVKIPLDLFLIPWTHAIFGNGAMGGALAFIVTESAMLAVGLYLIPHGTLGRSNLWLAIRVFIAGTIMLVAVWLWQDIFIAVPVAVGVVTYVIMILIMRVVPKEDWDLLRDLGQGLLKRYSPGRTEPAKLKG